MSGKTIGLNLNHGFAGSYARQPDMIINTRPNKDTTDIVFGRAVVKAVGGVANATASVTAADFVGVAAFQVETQLNYLDQNAGGTYVPDAPVSVFQRGRINVLCKLGNPEVYAPVYIATAADATSGTEIGDFQADATNGVLLPNCQWGGTKDGNNVAELVILSAVNA